MLRKNLRYLFILSAVCLSVAVFALFFNRSETSAGLVRTWITIDQNELQVVADKARTAGNNLDFEVLEVKNGIAVVKTTNGETEKLSTLMHQNFHKCAGFIAHDSEADALQSIDETFAARPDAPAVTYTIDNGANVSPMLAQIQELPIRQTIIDLSTLFPNRRHNQTSGLNSANWIKDKWTQMTAGRSDISVAFFNHPAATTPQPSIIMTIQGTTLPNEVVVLGAHQDSINVSGQTLNAPGADDDASGIASLTETIRVMLATNFHPQRTVKFMAYAAEEVGLKGSNGIATNFQANNVNVVGVFQLDMTNYHGSSADIVMISDNTNAAQNQFVKNLISAYQPTVNYIDSPCGYGCSDHASWTNKGYPASFPFEARVTPAEDNPNIHTANDTISFTNNSASNSLRFVKLAVSYVGELAKGAIVSNAPNRVKFDYDGDGKADVSVFRPSRGAWYLNQSTNGLTGVAFGQNGDKIVPADYDGDGKTDIAVYRSGIWYLNRSQTGFTGIAFGAADDVPVPADFDGDGKAELCVFRPSNGVWYFYNLTDNLFTATAFGQSGDRPVPADYDGDGKTDVAVFRPSINTWFTSTNPATNFGAIQFGTTGDRPVPADYDGDGKADVAVFRNGDWYIRRSSGGFSSISFGLNTDLPVAADYDGDGKADVAVFRNGAWYLNRSTAGFTGIVFGAGDDLPTPNVYVP